MFGGEDGANLLNSSNALITVSKHAGGEAGARGADHAHHRGRPPRLYTCGHQWGALPSGHQPVRLQSYFISATLSY